MRYEKKMAEEMPKATSTSTQVVDNKNTNFFVKSLSTGALSMTDMEALGDFGQNLTCSNHNV